MLALPQKTLETILVVDDNAEVLKVVVRTLENANFHVLSAGNAPDALMRRFTWSFPMWICQRCQAQI
jgi:CheY-like chemotaxis protein